MSKSRPKPAKKDQVTLAADLILLGREPASVIAYLRRQQPRLSVHAAGAILDAAKQRLQARARAYPDLHEEISIARLTDLYRRTRRGDARVALRCAEQLRKLRPQPQAPGSDVPQTHPFSFEERYRQSMRGRRP